MGPPLAAAYVAPYMLGLPAAAADIASVGLVVPSGVILGVALSRTVARMRDAQAAQQVASEALARASVTDELTGLGNRRAANTMLDGPLATVCSSSTSTISSRSTTPSATAKVTGCSPNSAPT